MTKNEQGELIATLKAHIEELETQLREASQELAFEEKITADLHEKVARLEKHRGIDPQRIAAAVHELLYDEGMAPGDLPWKVAPALWRQKLLGVLSRFEFPDPHWG
jgi:hypothetical protein